MRIAAAENLAKFGGPADVRMALDYLLTASDVRQTDYYDAVMALNAVDELKPMLSGEQLQCISVLPRTRSGQSKRTGDYVERLLTSISKQPGKQTD